MPEVCDIFQNYFSAAERNLAKCMESRQQHDDLENRIEHWALVLHTAKTPGERSMAWDTLKDLHGRRSSQRIADMEREAGLR